MVLACVVTALAAAPLCAQDEASRPESAQGYEYEYDYDQENAAPPTSAPLPPGSAPTSWGQASAPAATAAPAPAATAVPATTEGEMRNGVLTIIGDPDPAPAQSEEELLDGLFAPLGPDGQPEVNLTPYDIPPTTKVPAAPGEARVELVEPPQAPGAAPAAAPGRARVRPSPEYRFWNQASKNWNQRRGFHYRQPSSLVSARPLYAIDQVTFPRPAAGSGPVYARGTAPGGAGALTDLTEFPRIR
jgi:hypothetical protein